MRMNLHIHCLSEAISPITQARGTAGNESLINREKVATPLGERQVPVISGNAFRHQIREHGCHYLLQRMAWSGTLNERRLNFLFSGGNLTDGGGRENTGAVAGLHDAMPILSLLGGCLPNQMLRGRLNASMGRLICRENQSAIAASLPDGFMPDDIPLRAADSFVGFYQNVRGDASRNMPHHLRREDIRAIDAQGDDRKKSDQMIFSGQCVISGAHFVHGFLGKGVSELEAGALLLALSHWRDAGNTIGGKAAVGHGRLNTMIHCDPAVDAGTLISGYVAHVEAAKEAADAWMSAAFPFADPNAAQVEPKGRKGGKRGAA